jgi:tRNA modification GTPase
VGKSSLLNTLLFRERAIVTPFPGTTRDTIEEEIEIDGYLVKLIDTAGLCETENPLDMEGIKRTRYSLKESDLVIFLFDGSCEMTQEDREIFFSLNGKRTILAVNKIDLPLKLDLPPHQCHWCGGVPLVRISATQGINIEGLIKEIKELLWKGEVEPLGTEIIVSLRHEEILKSVRERIIEAIRGLEEERSEELIASDVKEAVSFLGRITGDVYSEDILDRIFSKFCVGK